MIDTLFWFTGAAVWVGNGLIIAAFILFLLYKAFKATVDVASQLLYLKVLKKPRAEGVSLTVAWWSSFDQAEWERIGWRFRQMMKGKTDAT